MQGVRNCGLEECKVALRTWLKGEIYEICADNKRTVF